MVDRDIRRGIGGLHLVKVLATGAAGYIGSQCVHELCAAGVPPIVFDSLLNGYPGLLPREVQIVVGDVRDRETVYRTLIEHEVDTIIHFAGLISAPESFRTPDQYYDVNTVGLLRLTEAAQKAGVRRVIFSSTAAVYAPFSGLIAESAQIDPASPYGKSKYAAELILKDLAHAAGFDYVVLRYFNVAGADPDMRTGQLNARTEHIFKVALDVARGRRELVVINGQDYATPDGTCIRDFVHVKDLARAHVKALQWMLTGGRNETFNCGNGRGYSVLEVTQAVERVSGKSVPIRIGSRRQGDLAHVVADPAKGGSMLGWSPEYKEIDDIAGHAWQWLCHASRMPDEAFSHEPLPSS